MNRIPRLKVDDNLISTTKLGEELGGFVIPPHVLMDLGIEPAMQIRNGYYWKKEDIPRVCRAIAKHLLFVAGDE